MKDRGDTPAASATISTLKRSRKLPEMNRCINKVTICSSLGNVTLTLAGSCLFTQATGRADYTGFQIPISITSTRYIKFDVADNRGGDFSIGLAEVQFNSVTEPGSLALLGLGGVLIGVRRRS
ncbi:MAG: PEP-CTERM sorting domain-containing protein [Planctomycetota bacterium]